MKAENSEEWAEFVGLIFGDGSVTYRKNTNSIRFQLIGSHNPKHITKFKIAQKFGYCPTKTTIEQRKQILKGFIDPLSIYRQNKAGVG